jgi:hypothetical protein
LAQSRGIRRADRGLLANPLHYLEELSQRCLRWSFCRPNNRLFALLDRFGQTLQGLRRCRIL